MRKMRIPAILPGLLAACLVKAQTPPAGSPAPASLVEMSRAVETLARSASPAVVQIVVKTLAPIGKDDLQRTGIVSEQQATGSGVIVDPDGYIITNAHVVRDARHIDVKVLRSDKEGEQLHGHLTPAKLIGLDRQVDIAVLKIDGKDLPALAFSNSDNLHSGEFVLAVGSPLGLQNSLTHGIISATARQLNPESPMVYVQTDAPINPGNSGGPLLDLEGQIVGINTMIYSESGGNEGIGFAVPANSAQEVYWKLRKDGRVRRGAIGVIGETITPTLAAGLGLDRDWGVILSDVAPHGSAEAADLESGDIVLSIDGTTMREERDLALAVFQHAPGDELHMEIQRGTEHMSKVVPLLDRQNDPSQLADLVNYDSALVRELGILAVNLNEKVLEVLPNLRRFSGVAVAAVPAEYAGFNPGLTSGDVIYSLNNKRIASLDELRAELAGKKSGDPIVFLVERMGQLVYVTAKLE